MPRTRPLSTRSWSTSTVPRTNPSSAPTPSWLFPWPTPRLLLLPKACRCTPTSPSWTAPRVFTPCRCPWWTSSTVVSTPTTTSTSRSSWSSRLAPRPWKKPFVWAPKCSTTWPKYWRPRVTTLPLVTKVVSLLTWNPTPKHWKWSLKPLPLPVTSWAPTWPWPWTALLPSSTTQRRKSTTWKAKAVSSPPTVSPTSWKSWLPSSRSSPSKMAWTNLTGKASPTRPRNWARKSRSWVTTCS